MTAYLTLAEFRAQTLMPGPDVDALEVSDEGWIEGQLEHYSRKIDTLLRKRYAVPFATPPKAVKEWLCRIVTERCFLKRGVDPLDQQFVSIKEDRAEAIAEIKEAADAEKGLWELPLDDTKDESGVSKGGPFGYSEASPYVWQDVQRNAARSEDTNGSGTGG